MPNAALVPKTARLNEELNGLRVAHSRQGDLGAVQLREDNERLAGEAQQLRGQLTSSVPAATCPRPVASNCRPRTRVCTVDR